MGMHDIPLYHHHRWEAYMSRLLMAIIRSTPQGHAIKSMSCLDYITLPVSFPPFISGRVGQEFPYSSVTEPATGAAQDVCL